MTSVPTVDAPAGGAAYPPPMLFIGGQWLDGAGRDISPVRNPATGEAVGALVHATADDLEQALAAADAAFGPWRRTSAFERGGIIRRAAALLRERVEAIAAITTLEQGKPLHEARGEILAAADVFDWFAEEGRRAYGRVVPSRAPEQLRYLVLRQPVGPVAAFSPWNIPALIPARKIAASLAAGCTCIIKPAEETPGTCLQLARALDDAGLPAGVLNVVTGVPATISQTLVASARIRKLSFTGSTAVGRQLGALAGGAIKRMTLELGGHAPVLVFADADIDAAVDQLVAFKYRNAGQVCIAPTRFYVQRQVHDRFVARFAAAAAALAVGDGRRPGVQMGPLANPRRIEAMRTLVDDAVAAGAERVCGGRIDGPGNFWAPTVLADVPDAARIMREEPFGPVAVTAPFDSVDEAIARANQLPFGLAAYAWTGSIRTAHRLSEEVESGMLAINNTAITFAETPFGGVKDSGYGSEGGSEGLEGYLDTKLVSLAGT
ncbi:NAD-dependent succinate-semialdehyde dehydrogenase [Luteimonas sp. BDR2-5]|uniref:NAD-dependent succinate-semialdehyde dehydrogenase n=1 Tax=Proluteimonas luteida TaxID=2878685 RepID=UPI001E643FA8|nr:NAD-dependent succinate-semialdehyde dehydrogenase [Luteimonas sp. BDR2-5]MCD9028726.1 NAD-dependent succinate-semialdehyde dehydrogenase [Luteimonas sp. BDR2-5]